jgi:hypothetical protein
MKGYPHNPDTIPKFCSWCGKSDLNIILKDDGVHLHKTVAVGIYCKSCHVNYSIDLTQKISESVPENYI